MNAATRFLKWLTSRERRQAERSEQLPLVAHYWDGGPPMSHRVHNISASGLYLLTEQRWYPGTLVLLSLQREDLPPADPNRSISVNGRVIRSGADGVGFSLVMPQDPDVVAQSRIAIGADKETYLKFLEDLQSSQISRKSRLGVFSSSGGQALIEYALTLPIIFLLIVNLVNFAGFFFAWITVANASRAGADYAVLGGASAGGTAGTISTPTASQIIGVINADVASLPNNASASINICQSYNGTVTTVSGTCSSSGAPTDPEASSYTFRWIDVNYTYVPFIPAGFQFASLNVYVSIPPTTIHRRVVVRMIE